MKKRHYGPSSDNNSPVSAAIYIIILIALFLIVGCFFKPTDAAAITTEPAVITPEPTEAHSAPVRDVYMEMEDNVERRITTLMEEYGLSRDEFNALSASVTEILAEEYADATERLYGYPIEKITAKDEVADAFKTGNYPLPNNNPDYQSIWNSCLEKWAEMSETPLYYELDQFAGLRYENGDPVTLTHPALTENVEFHDLGDGVVANVIAEDQFLAYLNTLEVDNLGYLIERQESGGYRRLLARIVPRIWIYDRTDFDSLYVEDLLPKG